MVFMNKFSFHESKIKEVTTSPPLALFTKAIYTEHHVCYGKSSVYEEIIKELTISPP